MTECVAAALIVFDINARVVEGGGKTTEQSLSAAHLMPVLAALGLRDNETRSRLGKWLGADRSPDGDIDTGDYPSWCITVADSSRGGIRVESERNSADSHSPDYIRFGPLVGDWVSGKRVIEGSTAITLTLFRDGASTQQGNLCAVAVGDSEAARGLLSDVVSFVRRGLKTAAIRTFWFDVQVTRAPTSSPMPVKLTLLSHLLDHEESDSKCRLDVQVGQGEPVEHILWENLSFVENEDGTNLATVLTQIARMLGHSRLIHNALTDSQITDNDLDPQRIGTGRAGFRQFSDGYSRNRKRLQVSRQALAMLEANWDDFERLRTRCEAEVDFDPALRERLSEILRSSRLWVRQMEAALDGQKPVADAKNQELTSRAQMAQAYLTAFLAAIGLVISLIDPIGTLGALSLGACTFALAVVWLDRDTPYVGWHVIVWLPAAVLFGAWLSITLEGQFSDLEYAMPVGVVSGISSLVAVRFVLVAIDRRLTATRSKPGWLRSTLDPLVRGK